jgi:hypothetical protein
MRQDTESIDEFILRELYNGIETKEYLEGRERWNNYIKWNMEHKEYYGPKEICFMNVQLGSTIQRVLKPSREVLEKGIGIAKFNGGGCACTGKPVVEMLRMGANKEIMIRYKVPNPPYNKEIYGDSPHVNQTKIFSLAYTDGHKETYIININHCTNYE